MELDLTRKQRLVIIGLCFAVSVVLYATRQIVFPENPNLDSVFLLTALISVAGFISVYGHKDGNE